MAADKLYLGALDIPDQLVGARVLVRPFTRADAPALRAAIDESRDHLLPWLPWANGHLVLEETIDFCVRTQAHWLTREQFVGGVFHREDGRLLGGIGLHPRDWKARSFEIGYWLRQGATGKGYMREAVAVMTRMAFDVLDANRVVIRCDALNERSRRVAEGCGYVFEGKHRRDALTPQGTLRDTLVFSLLREEYEAQLPQWQALLGATPNR